jgi:hypothetical protein
MLCPPEDDRPEIYELLAITPQFTSAVKYVYSEPYWYSNVFIFENFVGNADYENAFVGPAVDDVTDNFEEAQLKTYDPFHNRRANVTSKVGSGYGNWLGSYTSISDCTQLSGFYVSDLEDGILTPIAAPTWDASIYKYPPSCLDSPDSFDVDANNYKISYAYFVADHSAANEAFFDIEQEVSWRYPETLPKTGYLTPASISG